MRILLNTGRRVNDPLNHNSISESKEPVPMYYPGEQFIKQEVIYVDESHDDGGFIFNDCNDHTIDNFIQENSVIKHDENEKLADELSEPGKSVRDKIMVHCQTCNITSEKPACYKTRTPHCGTCNTVLTWCCVVCNRQYALYESARSHVRFACCGRNPLYCSHCNFTSTNKYNLLSHLKNVHAETDLPSWHRCIRCKRQYKHRKHLQRHERSCGRVPHIKCRWCGYRCKRNDHLTQHMKHKHPDMNADESRVMTYVCPGCSKKYKYKTSLGSHMKQCLEYNSQSIVGIPSVINVISLANNTI
ncbi:telomere zinc finger-associated protein-like [Phymastichus coffea]|uniref:telomere zinc finger-associated protein-like n=1 Tax=Phymastichus coffea TaxID=108790 RepID=UPI00273C72B3|nr:telomere zinc finger-associated protein-like [Phymastichus coffea]